MRNETENKQNEGGTARIDQQRLVRRAFQQMDDFAAKSLCPEDHDKWCDLVRYWSEHTQTLKGVQKNYHMA